MSRGVKIVKLFDITIRIDWSWLLILLLVVWNLSFTFSQIHPEWSVLYSIVIGIAAAMLFFLSVLAHELAHSLVAKSQGIPVDSITLFLFGGVANIREEPNSPGKEFLMAVLGPVTSIVIGSILLFVSGIGVNAGEFQNIQPMETLGGFGALRTLGFWIGSINIILGLFNLIPAYPLDGGRILRSILWAFSRNLRKATRWASFVGQVIAWMMIVSGIAMIFGVRIPFFGEGLANGIWLILIGWFLSSAAQRGYQQLVLRNVLEDVPVRRMTRRNPPTVPGNISVDDLVENYIMQTQEHAFPVLENDVLVGIVCLDDVRRVPGHQRGEVKVSDIMTPRSQLITVSPEDDSLEVLHTLGREDIRQLVVMEGDTLVGLIRRQDILRFLQLQSDNLG